MNKREVNEIVSLNLEDLDVAALERRLELATALPGAQWIGGGRDRLGTHCIIDSRDPCPDLCMGVINGFDRGR